MYWQVILLSLLAIDLAFLNFKVFTLKPTTINQITNNTPTSVDQCGPACQKYIDNKISRLPTQPIISKNLVTTTIPAHKKIRTTSYLPISTSGSTDSREWISLSGTDFYFDTYDYPGLIEIYFETNIHLFNGNGIAFIRLFDDTHGVGIQGSEVQSNQQKDTAVISGKVSFYAGKNLIKVQAKSLTADTAIFTSGRLRIVTEN